MYLHAIASPAPDLLQMRVDGEVSDPSLTMGESQPMLRILGHDCFARGVLVDMSFATAIDTGGVAWLVGCHKEFERGGGRMVIHSVPLPIMQVFDLLKLGTLLYFAPTEADAVFRLHHG